MAAINKVPPTFISEPTIKQDKESTVTIVFEVKASPKPTLLWSHNGKTLKDTTRIKSKIDGIAGKYKCSLTLLNVNKEDAGLYKCIVKNIHGELSASINLLLEPSGSMEDSKSEDRAPKFLDKPTIKQEEDGKRIVFECKLLSETPPTVEWFINNNKIKDEGRFLLYCDPLPNNTYLAGCEIDEITIADAGVYRIVARNSIGESAATITLNLTEAESSGKPVITESVNIRQFLERIDDIAVIECNCTSEQKPEFVWQLNGKLLKASNKYRTLIIKDKSTFVCMIAISKATKSDSGMYKLFAKNAQGEDSKEIKLNVVGAKKLPSGSFPSASKKPFLTQSGTSYVIETEFTSVLLPFMYWLKEGKDISDHRLESTFEKAGPNSYRALFVIRNAESRDAGTYECFAVNEHGSASVTAKLIYKNKKIELVKTDSEHPLITTTHSLFIDEKKRIISLRDVKGIPQPTLKYFNEKGELKDSKKFRYSLKNDAEKMRVELEILDFTKRDDGFFKMTLKNEAGTAAVNEYISEENAKKTEIITLSKPKITRDETNRSVLVEIQCSAKNDFVQNWYKETELLKEGEKYSFDIKKTEPTRLYLKIRNCNEKDAGNYLISVKNDSNEATMTIDLSSKDVIFDKSMKKAGIKPKFVTKPNNAVLFDGEKAIVQCKISGDPIPSVLWYRDGKRIDNTKNLKLENDDKTARLIINDAYVEDSGVYICELSNELGEETASCQITVKETKGKPKRTRESEIDASEKPQSEQEEEQGFAKRSKESIPSFVLWPSNKTMTEGVTDSIEAEISGNPFPNAKWFKGTKEILEGIKYHIFCDEKTGKIALEIVRPKSDDDGQYALKISNKSGEMITEFRVFVKPKGTKNIDFRDMLKKRPSQVMIKPRFKDDSNKDEIARLQEISEEQLIEEEEGMSSLQPLDEGAPRVKRESQVRRASLAEVIPDWPALKKTAIKKKEKDHWVHGLEDLKVSESDGTAVFTATFCKSGGKLRWYKNRVEIFHGLKYNFVTRGAVQKLIINKLHPDDSGRYICSVNEIETKAWLEVTPAKTEFDFYKTLPARMEVFRTKTTILECHVNSPECPVKWYKGNDVLTSGKNYKIYMDAIRCILRIQRTAKEDEGVYKCEIDTESHKNTTCYLYVTEPQWRFKKKLPSVIEVDENKEAVLEVELEDPDAECEWYYKGEIISEEDYDPEKYAFFAAKGVRRLIIKDCSPETDIGKYECKTGVMTTSTDLQVIPALKIVKNLMDITAAENSDVVLEVELNKPNERVSWFKNDHRILSSTSKIILNEGVKYSLTLKDVGFEDAGTYHLKAEGIADCCNVTVVEAEKPPRIDMGQVPKLVDVAVGNEIKFSIPFYANPIPEAIWTIDGKVLSQDRITSTVEDNKVILTIPKSEMSDNGTYELLLKNKLGVAKAEIPVKVSDKPDAPEGPVRITEVTKNSCRIGWREPLNDGGSEIKRYIIEKLDTSRAEWQLVEEVPGDTLTCRIPKLTEKKEYKFRVCAVNKNGKSEPLETSKPIIAKDPYDPPSVPGVPVVIDKDSTSIEIEWKPPEKDGGDKIIRYIIEKREKGKEWSKDGVVDGSILRATVPNLTENTEYEFRITAENKAGKSEPSDISLSAFTKPKVVAPKIDKLKVRPITIKKGQSIKIEVPFVAQPMPTVQWYIDDKEITDTITARIDNENDKTTLTIEDADRCHTGKYAVKVSNIAGSDTIDCPVIVLAPPSSPEGPLKVENVTKNSATLSWKPPLDDGGKKITNYVVEKRDVQTGVWSKVSDIVYDEKIVVPKLIEGHDYEFRVMAENPLGMSEPLVTEFKTKAKNPYDEPGAPAAPVPISRDRDHIEIEWEPPLNDGGAPVEGYVVERRDEKSKKWVKLNPNKLINSLRFNDSSVSPNHEYEYRITAVNAAGLGKPSDTSGAISAKPEKEIPSIDLSSLPEIRGKREIRVRAGEPLILDFPIIGTPSPTAEFTKDGNILIEVDGLKTECNDVHISISKPISSREDSGTYKLKLQNELGMCEADINVSVLDVPEKCKGPIDVLDTTKTSITFQWNPPNDDGGSPITGYIIEKCPEGSKTWEICPESAVTSKVTIKNLTQNEKYKFRVRAENKYGLSEPLEMPDFVKIKPPYDAPSPPSQPEVTSYNTNFIALKWNTPSNDGGNPIQGYIIEKREKNGNWEQCSPRLIRGTEYTVLDVRPNRSYEFRVKAVNDAGPSEPSKPSKFQKAENPIVPPGAPYKPIIDKITKKSVSLSWKKPNDDGGSKITAYVIEKRDHSSMNWDEIKELPGNEHSLTIDNLEQGEQVEFRISAKNIAGKGEPSESTGLLIVEDQPERPTFIDYSGIKDITVKAGQGFEAHARYKGFPKPIVEFAMNDEIFVPNERVACKVLDDVISITNVSSKRSDTGEYKVTLKNAEGSCTMKFNVTVLDVPGKPEGPLEVLKIDAEKCTLSWNAPKDDGGLNVVSYVVEKRIVGSDKWVKACAKVRTPHCEITGLQEGQKYEFRVMAENANGIGEPLETEEPVKAKWPFRPPDAPGTPSCKSHTIDSITIEWAKPKNDGGNPINGYVVEKKEKNSNKWTPVSKQLIFDTEFTVTGLNEDDEYDFRVAAVNKAGHGDWAETDCPFQACAPDSAPKPYGFDFGTKEIKVKAGQPLNISIPFTGSPLPTATFTKGGETITDGTNSHIRIEKGLAELVVPVAKEEHSGLYSCTLKNNIGQSVVAVKVIVLDKPSSPQGPLTISDVTPDGCILKWAPPKNDGGEPVTNYIVEKMDVKTGRWETISKYCRKPCYEVFDLLKGHEYKFRVRAENINGVSEPLEADHSIIAEFPFSKPAAPDDLEVIENKNQMVSLRWNRPKSDGGSRILGYQVEMQEGLSDDWIPVSGMLIKDTTFTVDNLQPGKSYNFRVKAKNEAGFGDAQMLDKPIVSKGPITAPDSPSVPEVLSTGKDFVELTWSSPINDGGAAITGYLVEKKGPNSDTWESVFPFTISDESATIYGLPENSEFEFRVKAVNKAGESQPSLSTGKVKVTAYPDGREPFFKKELFNKEGIVNGFVSFDVEFDGYPLPEVKWFRNGLELAPGTRYGIKTSDNASSLSIYNIWDTEDGTEIMCKLLNPIGTANTSCILKVKLPPKLEVQPNDQTVDVGATFKLRIPVEGKGPFNFKVKKDGEAFPLNEKFSVNEVDGAVCIVLSDSQRSDSGNYSITIGNDAGIATANFKLDVLDVPNKPEGPLNVTDITKSSCRLSWKAPQDDGGRKVSHYIVEKRDVSKPADHWIQVGSEIKDTNVSVNNLLEKHEYEFRVSAVNEKGKSEPLYTLQTSVAKHPYDSPKQLAAPEVVSVGSNNVKLRWKKPVSTAAPVSGYYIEKKEKESANWLRVNPDAPILVPYADIPLLINGREYEFRVIAVNDAGEGAPSESTGYILIRDENEVEPPQILEKLSDAIATEGSPLKLEIKVKSSQPPDVVWMKGSTELHNGSSYTISREGEKCMLIINNPTIDDADIYTVKVRNSGGAKSSSANVDVKTRPRIKLPSRYETPLTFDEGEDITLKIPYTGNPLPAATWFFKNAELKPDDNIKIEQTDRYIILKINNASVDQSGEYRLRLKNEIGEAECSVEINVTGIPNPPRNLTPEETYNDTVVLAWSTPDNDGGSPIINYILERQECGDGDKWVRSGMSRSTRFAVQNLQEGHEYRFRVIAENIHGRSLPSQPTGTVRTNKTIKINAPYGYDEKGKRRRGIEDRKPDNYDKCFHDIWKDRRPSKAVPKVSSIYDYYDIYEEIGSGAYGVVHRAVEIATGKNYAVKFIETPTSEEKQMVREEIGIMNQLSHPKLLHLHDVFEEPGETAMVLEFMAGGDLLDKISDPTYRMTEKQAAKYIKQVCEGLKEMHEQNIVHLDIKPENIMLEKRTNENVKIVDFGLAHKLAPDEKVQVSVASVEFASPEVIEQDSVGFYTDMWAIGVLTYVILSGISPFGGEDDEETCKNIEKCDLKFPSEGGFDEISENAKDFISKLIVREKGKRMTVHEALEHPWLKEQPEDEGKRLNSERFLAMRDKINQKYGGKKDHRLGIGRLADFSSLRKLKMNENKLRDTYFDRKEAAPRFIIKPHDAYAIEGDNAEFECRVIGLSPPTVSWYRSNSEIKQSTKYMKKYSDPTYILEVKRCTLDEEGQYEVRASNSYGEKTVSVRLYVNVIKTKKTPEIQEYEKYKHIDFPLVDIWEEPDRKPFFTYQLRSRIIQAYQPVKLTCTCTGKPLPKIKWFKDKNEITNSDIYRMDVTHGVCSLEIDCVTASEVGSYRCVAENKLGSAETSCQLLMIGGRRAKNNDYARDLLKGQSQESSGVYEYIHSPSRKSSMTSGPSLVRGFEPLTVSKGHDINLECEFMGEFGMTIKWTKDSKLLMSNERIHQTFDESKASLIINSSELTDSGNYSCIATDKFGSVECEAYIQVTDATEDETFELEKKDEQPVSNHAQALESDVLVSQKNLDIPRFEKFLKSQCLLEGTTLVLECKLAGCRRLLKQQLFMSIFPLAYDQNGMTLLFLSGIVPKVLLQNIDLICNSTQETETPVNISWFRNGKEVPDNPDFKRENIDRMSRLTVTDIFPEDSGTFSVIASNDFYKRESACSIIIQATDDDPFDPQIEVFPESLSVKEGESACFYSEFKGTQPIKATWFYGDDALSSSDRIRFYEFDNKTSLEIYATATEDEGSYKLTLSNPKGEMTCVFSLCIET